MAHELTNNDSIVLHKTRAWHGMGTIVDEAPTPAEALKIADLGWDVIQRPLEYTVGEGDDAVTHTVDSHVINCRSDLTGKDAELGIVGCGYQPVQNETLVDFAYRLAGESANRVRVETAGSIRGGRSVWFLLKGEAFDVKLNDTVVPYLLLSNSHDGGSAFRVTPTSIRTVCSNTLHAVIPLGETEDSLQFRENSFSVRHSGNILGKVETCREALRKFGKVRDDLEARMRHLAAKQVTTDQVSTFFQRMWTAEFGTPEAKDDSVKEQRRVASAKRKMHSAMHSFTRRFDDEKAVAGATMWNTFNAWSGLIQHDMKARGKNDADRVAKRIEGNLFGLNQERTERAFALALNMSS